MIFTESWCCSRLKRTKEISYVESLERRVIELEEQLKSFRQKIETDHGSSAVELNGTYNDLKQPRDCSADIESTSNGLVKITSEDGVESAKSGPRGTSALPDSQLASELENLSLKAIAEKPFLGSSSGVSFARLTQAVLRRLDPDQYAFTSVKQSPDSSVGYQQHRDASSISRALQVGSNEYSQMTLPPKEQAYHLEEFYWSHTHSLYPFLQKTAFKKVLAEIYANPDCINRLPASALYRVWMVLAVGSTTLSSIGFEDGSQSGVYYEKAMAYFEGALTEGSIVW